MTPEAFVRARREAAFESAVDGTMSTLANPPGRKPWPTTVAVSEWFNGLSPEEQRCVRWVVRDAAYAAIFNVTALLDGVATIDDQRGRLTLSHMSREGTQTQLNQPELEELHSLWTSEVFPPAEPLDG